MYFPYLYGRRSELLALRAIVPEFDIRETVVPIFEPVKADSGDLRRGMRALGEAEVKTIIVTNPAQGEFKASRGNPAASVPTWRASIGAEFSEFPSNIPGFLCRPEIRIADITAFLNRYPDREVALIYWSPRLTNAELRSLVAERRIQFHVNLHDSLSADQRRILPTSLIRQHLLSQQTIRPTLIPLAVLLQPGNHIRIQPQAHRLLHRTIKLPAPPVPPSFHLQPTTCPLWGISC